MNQHLMALADNYAADAEANLTPTVDLGDWLVTFLLTAIPVVGFVLLCVWAFGRQTLPSKANWAKAVLVLYALGLAIGIGLLGLTKLARPADQVQSIGPSYKVVP